MTRFKVGDRVRWPHDGEEGTVVSLVSNFGEDSAEVEWDVGGKALHYLDDFELVEEQPNRTYYEGATPPSSEDMARVRELLGATDPTPFATNVHRILTGVAETVVQKNLSYGDSALKPIRVFSKADRMEQLFVRLDDKLSRVQRGSEYPGDDTLRDIIGYATLILIARESE